MKIMFFKKIGSWFRLFRWKNLLMIALTMMLVRYAIIHPLLGITAVPLHYSHADFLMLVLSIIFIAAAGYVINDYFDVRIDRINKPGKMILGRDIPFSQALTVHQVFSTLGIILGFYTAYQTGSFRIGGFQAVLVALLWYYSYRYKAIFIWGNLLVSLVTGFAILIVWLFEFYSLKNDILIFGGAIAGFKVVNKVIFCYFFFTVLLSLVREITKDIADIQGDSRYGHQTLAVKTGEKTASAVALGLILFILTCLVLVQLFLLPGFSIPLLVYTILFVDIPVVILAVMIHHAKETGDFIRISKYLKGLMVSGILSMIFITL